MRERRCREPLRGALALLVALSTSAAAAENIDPANDGSQHAWGENAGWLNAEPSGEGGPGVHVGDFELTGWMWGENIGWVSLSCQNTSSCPSVSYGVSNNGFGVLSGFAWGENVGWINFAPLFSGATINSSTGQFSGRAWAENIGWVAFAGTATDGTPYAVRTGWCSATAAPPGSAFTLDAAESGADILLSWSALGTASWYDIVRGMLSTLRSNGGDFAASTDACVTGKIPATSYTFSGPSPPPGDGFWFLVRGANCKGRGTYDTGLPSQVGLRDAEIAASGNDCP